MVDGKAMDCDFKLGPLQGGVTFYPYQIAFGLTLRYWPCLFAPAFRIHILCFKVWGMVSFRRRAQDNIERQFTSANNRMNAIWDRAMRLYQTASYYPVGRNKPLSEFVVRRANLGGAK